MDDIIEAIVELFGNLLESALKGIKNEKKRTWALTVFYSIVCLSLVTFFVWNAVCFYLEGNLKGAATFASMAVLAILLIGFILLRRIIRKRKNKKL